MLRFIQARLRSIRFTQVSQIYFYGWLGLGAMSCITFLIGFYLGMRFANLDLAATGIGAALSVAMLFYLLFGSDSRVGPMLAYFALWVATFTVARSLTYVMAALGFPVIDDSLDAFDKALGFDWLQWRTLLEAYPQFNQVLAFTYAKIGLAILITIVYFSHRGELHRQNEFWWIAFISVAITALVSGIFPAMGSFEYYGVADSTHGTHLPDLHALRDGTMVMINLDALRGIVTLPSYHTVLAILLIYIYRFQPRALMAVAPFNLSVLVAIPSEGGHYIADMVAGALVTAFSAWMVTRLGLGAKPSLAVAR